MTIAFVVRARISAWFNNRIARRGNERLVERALLLLLVAVTATTMFALFGHAAAHSLTVSGGSISQLP